MAVGFHVNGTAGLTIDSNALGVASSDGVKVDLNEYFNEIKTDNRGPDIPEEVLRNGNDALITCELWKYDDTVLQNFMAKRDGGNVGQMGQIGELMFANNRTSVLIIASPVDGHVYTFGRCWLVDAVGLELSTQLKIVSITIKAVPDANNYLYTRT